MGWKVGEYQKGSRTFDTLPYVTIDYANGPGTPHERAIEIRGENCIEIAGAILPVLNDRFSDSGSAI